MEDKTLTCADCGEEFLFTVDEQLFYGLKGLKGPMKCRTCRAKMRDKE